MRGCLITVLIFLVTIGGIYFVSESSTEIDREIEGMMYTLDRSVEVGITIELNGVLEESWFDDDTFSGNLEISGEDVYLQQQIVETELSEGRFFVIIPKSQTPEGFLSGNITISKGLDKIIGSIETEDKQLRYYFGGPGNSLAEIMEIQISK